MAALIARLCRVGVFSLTAFVRDVTRLPNSPSVACGRLVRYVQLLPEPHERVSADARRALLRRHGLLPSTQQQSLCSTALERVLEVVKTGQELRCVAEGDKLRVDAEPGVVLTVAAGAVDEVSEAQQKAPEKVGPAVPALVSFLRAAGVAALAADFLLNALAHLLSIAAMNAARSQALYAGIVTAVECLPHLAPVLAATNQLATTMSILARVYNVPAGNTAQQRIRASADKAALMIGKYFCACSPIEHEHWKQLVFDSLPPSNFAPLKSLFCGLVAGVQPIMMEKQQALTSVKAFLTKSSQIVRMARQIRCGWGKVLKNLWSQRNIRCAKHC